MDKILRILHLEDSASDAELVRRVLKKGAFDFERLLVDTKAKFIEGLEKFSPDIVLSDHSLPSFNSYEALEIILERGINIPFILITANVSEEFAVDVIKRGADDYILKDRLKRLPTAIDNALEKYRFERERQFFIDNVIKNEKRFRALIENGSGGMAILSAEGKSLYVSPSMKNVLGYTDGESMNFELFTLAHPDEAATLRNLILEAVAQPGVPCKSSPVRMLHKNGKWKYIESVLTNMLHDPSIDGIVDNFIDITKRIEAETERKAAEELIVESEFQYRSLIQDLPVAVYTTDQNGKIQIYNKAATELWGREPAEEDLWCGSWKIFNNDGTSLPLNMCPMAVALNEGRNVYGEEIIIERPDRSMRNISPFPTTKLNNAGELIGAVNMLIDTTERKKDEEKIRRTTDKLLESEKKYRQIVETAQEGIWLVDENNKTTFVNNKLCQFLGYNKEEMIGRQPYFFMDEEGKQIAAKALQEKRDGLSSQQDFKYITKSKKEVWASVTANPVFDTQGNYNGALAMIADITDKKVLEILLDRAISLSRIGSYEADLINNVLFWSPMIKDIYELEADYIPVHETSIAFYKEGSSRENITKAYYELIEKNVPFDLEVQIVTAKGNERWVRVIGEAEWYNGVCSKVYGSFQDIDKFKKIEFEALKAYDEKNTILESIGDAFFAVDLNWTVTYWNKEAEKLLECPRNQIIGKNIWEVFEEISDTSFYKNYHEALQKDTIQHFEAYYEKTDCWFDVTVYPSLNGLSVYFKNVTERKLSDIKLIELNKDLQQYTSQLVISNTDLEQFSYIISHNLRAPIANLMGLTEELKDESHTDETKEMLNTALSSCVHLLNDVTIDLNAILTAKKEISERKEIVSLSDLITDIQLDIQKQIQTENVQIKTDFNQIDKILTLKSYLHSIFFQLITNSIKYRRSEISPVIDITSEVGDKYITIIFKDNGMGIDMKKRKDQVFGLYKRFHQHVEGKGIGLFMTKTKVETLGGKITVKSEVNCGSEFKITLPVEG